MATPPQKEPAATPPPSDRKRDRRLDKLRKRFPLGQGPDADQELINRCLDGEEKGWEDLYVQFQPRLVEAIKFLLGPEAQKIHLVDEIAARVWYSLLRDDARLLARFDVARNCRLDAFLMGISRMEILRYFRSERRRQAHEMVGGRRLVDRQPISDSQVAVMIDEFISTLTEGEREFMDKFLVSLPSEEDPEIFEITDSNVWQRRHRIRSKVNEFFEDI
jgi:DNA-directed RNA polymerase specialized sigma24 family protein